MRIFITHILPKDKILKYGLSIAGCNFSYNLIEAGIFDKVYSVLPTFISGEKNDFDFDGLAYSKLRHRGGHIARLLAPLAENLWVFKRIPHRADVWFYNLTILNALLIVLLKLLKRSVTVNVIVLDYTPSHSLPSRLFLWLTNHADGIIKLANSKLFTCPNYALLPGVVPAHATSHPLIKQTSRDFLISGALGENISMLSMLLRTFAQLPNCTLHITGMLPGDGARVRSYTKLYGNIHYYGKLSFEEYLRLLERVPFVLSTRNPAYPENRCNFPSKIIEALLYNRIIVSTLHYEQLKGIRYLEVPSGEQEFSNAIKDIAALPQAALLAYANQSDKVRELFSTSVWEKTMEQIEKADRANR